jgi:membrane protein involved in colicin uptake
MSEGQSQRSVASSVQHRQEAEVVAAEERERAAAETAAARAARLAMAELVAARAEVEAAAAADAARAAAAELEALRASSTDNFVSTDDDKDNELKLVREAAAHPQGRRGGSPDGRGRAGGWVDGNRGLYRRRDSPSPDRYHGHHGIQAIVRDVGPGGG